MKKCFFSEKLEFKQIGDFILKNLNPASPTLWYNIFYAGLILAFTYFYISIVFEPKKIADNIQKRGGFIPGIRPGSQTEEYLAKTSGNLTFWGGMFLAMVAVLPLLFTKSKEIFKEVKNELKNETLKNKFHGTSIAGVLVSKHPQIGIAPDAKLLSVSAFSSRPGHPNALRGKSSDIVKAIALCIDRKVDILNLSFTGGRDSFVETIVNEAVRQGIIVVAAGGNRGYTNSAVYPAVINGVVGVTAVDRLQHRYPKADKGRFIDIAAPGVNVLTTAPQGKYQRSTGTSMAAAHLSGVMALLKGYQRSYKPSQLNLTAIDLGRRGRDIEFGNGLVNASAALRQLGAPLPY